MSIVVHSFVMLDLLKLVVLLESMVRGLVLNIRTFFFLLRDETVVSESQAMLHL